MIHHNIYPLKISLESKLKTRTFHKRFALLNLSILGLHFFLPMAAAISPPTATPAAQVLTSVVVGTTSSTTVNISNGNSSILELSPLPRISPVGPFSISSNCSSIPAKGSCPITVVYKPTGPLTQSTATLTIAQGVSVSLSARSLQSPQSRVYIAGTLSTYDQFFKEVPTPFLLYSNDVNQDPPVFQPVGIGLNLVGSGSTRSFLLDPVNHSQGWLLSRQYLQFNSGLPTNGVWGVQFDRDTFRNLTKTAPDARGFELVQIKKGKKYLLLLANNILRGNYKIGTLPMSQITKSYVFRSSNNGSTWAVTEISNPLITVPKAYLAGADPKNDAWRLVASTDIATCDAPNIPNGAFDVYVVRSGGFWGNTILGSRDGGATFNPPLYIPLPKTSLIHDPLISAISDQQGCDIYEYGDFRNMLKSTNGVLSSKSNGLNLFDSATSFNIVGDSKAHLYGAGYVHTLYDLISSFPGNRNLVLSPLYGSGNSLMVSQNAMMSLSFPTTKPYDPLNLSLSTKDPMRFLLAHRDFFDGKILSLSADQGINYVDKTGNLLKLLRSTPQFLSFRVKSIRLLE